MRPILPLVLAIAILTATLGEPARAQDSAVYIATYIEVTPNAVDSAAALLEQYRDASRKEDGNLRFDVLTRLHVRPALRSWKSGKTRLRSTAMKRPNAHCAFATNSRQSRPHIPTSVSTMPLMAARCIEPLAA